MQLFSVAQSVNLCYTISEGSEYRMGQKEKLIRRLKSLPRDMTFDEIETLLRFLE